MAGFGAGKSGRAGQWAHVGVAHAARKAAMAGNWDFDTLLKERWAASYYLFAMRTAGVMHVMHMPQAARLAVAYFERVQGVVEFDRRHFELRPRRRIGLS